MYCVSWCEIAHIDNWLLRPDILKGGDAGGFQTVGHIPLVGNRSTVDGVQLTMEKYGVELNRINMFFEDKINNNKKTVSWCCHADQYFDKIQLGFFFYLLLLFLLFLNDKKKCGEWRVNWSGKFLVLLEDSDLFCFCNFASFSTTVNLKSNQYIMWLKCWLSTLIWGAQQKYCINCWIVVELQLFVSIVPQFETLKWKWTVLLLY